MPKNVQITIQLYLFHMPEAYAQNVKTVSYFIFLASKINADSDCSHEIKRLAPWKNSYDKPRQYVKKQRHHLANKGPYS